MLAEISDVMSEFPYDAYKNSMKQPNIWLSFSLGQHVQERIQALIASAPTLVVPLGKFLLRLCYGKSVSFNASVIFV